jgi:hypothetical protein
MVADVVVATVVTVICEGAVGATMAVASSVEAVCVADCCVPSGANVMVEKLNGAVSIAVSVAL